MPAILMIVSAAIGSLTHNPLLRGAGLLTTAQYAATGIGMAATVIAARSLGATEFGYASIAIAFPSMVWAFSTVKPVSIVTPYVSRFRAALTVDELVGMCQLGWTLDIGAVLLSLLIVAGSARFVASAVYGMPELAGMMVGYAALLLFAAPSGTSQGILTSFGKFGTISVLRSFRAVLLLVFVCISAWLHWRALGYVLAVGASQAVSGLVDWAVATRVVTREFNISVRSICRTRWRSLSARRGELRSLFGWNYFYTAVSSVGENALVLMTGRMLGPTESGYYRIAHALMVGVGAVEGAMARVVYSRVAVAAQAFDAKLRERLRRWTWRAGLPTAGAICIAVAALPLLVRVFFGEQYRPMVGGAQVMLIASAVGSLFFWLSPLFFSLGQVRSWAGINTFRVAFLVASGSILIPWLGFTGAAFATAFSKVLVPLAGVAMLAIASRERKRRNGRVHSPGQGRDGQVSRSA